MKRIGENILIILLLLIGMMTVGGAGYDTGTFEATTTGT
jgi:hypothetical protein